MSGDSQRNRIACTIKGVCGKSSSTSAAMDLLLFVVSGVCSVADILRENGIKTNHEVNTFVTDALFSTITNANFDDESILKRVDRGLELKTELKNIAEKENIKLPAVDEIIWNTENRNDESIHTFMQSTIRKITIGNLSADELTALTLAVGETGVKVMALLDKANTETYGNPEITKVNIGVGTNPGILISGHDLHDIEELLKQTEGTGVDVYTHSEMLPAHYYPAFKKYKHFIGNYGNAWWKQREEFSSFNGPVIFTTNCIVPPTSNAVYKDRIFTTNSTGYPGWKHITANENGVKDFSEVIELAKKCDAPTQIEEGEIIGGFAHNQILSLADKVVDAIKAGAIRKFIVMAGCDGRMKSRDYYTEFAKALPQDCVILTAGCAKYKYNKLPLGDINGIPRILDAGQCNDSYSLAVVAMKLKEVFNLNDINELPIAYNIAWYEQKAVIVLLALLSLGVKNIHLGPTLPAFLSPNVAKVLVDNFGIAGIGTVDEDMKTLGISVE